MEKKAFTPQLPLWSFQFQSSSRLEILSRRDIEARILVKAMKEDGFKEQLLHDPKTTIEQAFAIQLPKDLTIEVVEETSSCLYLVLPHNPYTGIPEEELKNTLGMDLNEIARWVLSRQKAILIEDEEKTVMLIANAWRSASFRRGLLTDPALIIEQAVGEPIEEGLIIKVLEEIPERIYIVLPALPDGDLMDRNIETQVVNQPVVIGSHHFYTSKNDEC